MTRMLEMALAESDGGIITRTLQSESPGGLAHSAIAALRRGVTPRQDAQEALDAVLEWREAWALWSAAYTPYHVLVSRRESAVRAANAATATAREVSVRGCQRSHRPRDHRAEGRQLVRRAARRPHREGRCSSSQGRVRSDPGNRRQRYGSLGQRTSHRRRQRQQELPHARRGRHDIARRADSRRSLPSQQACGRAAGASWARLHGSAGMKRAARTVGYSSRHTDPGYRPRLRCCRHPGCVRSCCLRCCCREAERRLASTTIAETAGSDAVQHMLSPPTEPIRQACGSRRISRR